MLSKGATQSQQRASTSSKRSAGRRGGVKSEVQGGRQLAYTDEKLHSHSASETTAGRRQYSEDDDEDDDDDDDDDDEGKADGSQSSPTRQRPKRGPLQSVCLHCRRAKLRCDRESPCMHCRKQQIECVYPSFEPAPPDDDDGHAQLAKRRRRRRHVQRPSISGDTSGSAKTSSSLTTVSVLSSLRSTEQSGWRDHLFSFFPGTRVQTQRMLVRLLRSIPAIIYREHYFHLFHMDAPIQAIVQTGSSSVDPLDVHPALIFAMVAFSLRMRLRPARRATSLIPLEGVPVPADRNDVALRIQREAEVMLSQSLTDPSVGTTHALSVGQAAAMVMKLQPEFTQAHSFYWAIVHQLTTSPLFRSYTDDGGTPSLSINHPPTAQLPADQIAHRNSIRAENAARLRLITLWTSLRQGYVFPNFEVLMGRFKLQDVENATVYTPFLDEIGAAKKDVVQAIRARQSPTPAAPIAVKEEVGSHVGRRNSSATIAPLRYDLGADDQSGILHPVAFRMEMFRFVIRCTTSWQVAQLDYVSPSPDFAAVLGAMDQRDAAGRVMQQTMAANPSGRPVLLKQLFAKRVVACAYLQGFLIRRIGIAHSAAMRPYVVEALRGEKPSKIDASGHNEVLPAWQRSFDSPTMMGWVELMRMFLQEVDEDYKMATVMPISSPSPPVALTLSHFSLDSLLLYAAASEQYGQGVAQVYRILSHPDPNSQPLAKALFDVANGLRLYVHRHRALHEQRGNPGPEPVRIAL